MPTRSAITLPVLVAALVAFLAPPAICQEPPPAPIAITTTESVPLGRWVKIHVETQGKGILVRVRQVRPGEDLDCSEGLLAQSPTDYGFAWDAGLYLVEALAIVDDTIVSAYATTRIGPPGPSPPPDPPPDPTPGQRWVLVVHETGQTTPELSRLIVSLRTGETAAYLSEKQHQLLILDDDHQALAPWVAAIEAKGVSLPALVIADPSTAGPSGALFVGSLPGSATEIVELVKRHGG